MSVPGVVHGAVIRVLLVEDHAIVAEAVTRRLENAGDEFEVVAHATSVRQALGLYATHRPDLVLCDVQLQGPLSGIDFVVELRGTDPTARVVMFSAHSDAVTVQRALDAGAAGFIGKHTNPAELPENLRQAVEGQIVFDSSTASAVIAALRAPSTPSFEEAVRLSPREQEVLEALCSGRTTNKELSKALLMTEHTVRSHLVSIFAKLEVTDRTSAVITAFRRNLVEVSEPG